MPQIVFDVFIPDAETDAPEKVRRSFQLALDILVDAGRLTSASLDFAVAEDVHPDVVAQLRQVFIDDREGAEPGEASVHRLVVDAAGESISYNELAMSLSRILTPKTDLPADPVLLHRQDDFEVPAAYPWTVEIRR